ncbi:LysR family transcriptional regulator [Alteromonadaceae bacterium M269]|nr:LysR family transcriptional regulator [Alteromonadaceae bacterium M269]
MDINQIRYFLALSRTLSFTKAAEISYVSQPALTQSIKRLEEELGGALIHRDGRNTRLTELGRLLKEHFEKIENIRGVVKKTARNYLDGKYQELHIGLMCTIGPGIISHFLHDFRRLNPGVLLFLHDVTYDEIPKLLRTGAMDGVIYASHDDFVKKNESTFFLYEESMVVAFHDKHAFSEFKEIQMSQIASERYVDRLHCEFRDAFLDYCRENAIEPKVIFRSQREDWILNFVSEGSGVCVIPQFSLLQQSVKFRPIANPYLSREVNLMVMESENNSKGLGSLIELASDYPWKKYMSA